ncbi:unnamed protein product [Prorocentrum cordatum]|uniref:Uncharacterized protein n=1 Tax=Prorocentrum cordatum TaxID=2364126 RepID=A0ABN9STH1_9DINO|nr:unnamed protein product [Polarella glacialis]
MAEDSTCAMRFAQHFLCPCAALPRGHTLRADCIERHMAALAENRLPARLSPEEKRVKVASRLCVWGGELKALPPARLLRPRGEKEGTAVASDSSAPLASGAAALGHGQDSGGEGGDVGGRRRRRDKPSRAEAAPAQLAGKDSATRARGKPGEAGATENGAKATASHCCQRMRDQNIALKAESQAEAAKDLRAAASLRAEQAERLLAFMRRPETDGALRPHYDRVREELVAEWRGLLAELHGEAGVDESCAAGRSTARATSNVFFSTGKLETTAF